MCEGEEGGGEGVSRASSCVDFLYRCQSDMAEGFVFTAWGATVCASSVPIISRPARLYHSSTSPATSSHISSHIPTPPPAPPRHPACLSGVYTKHNRLTSPGLKQHLFDKEASGSFHDGFSRSWFLYQEGVNL